LTRGGVRFGDGTGLIVFNHTATDYVFSPAIFGTGAVRVEAGTTILTGNNFYSQLTLVRGGRLLVNGSISSESIVEGGTLGGTGSLGRLVVNGGVYAPGNSIGTQTVNGEFILNPRATFEVEANAAGEADKVIVNGAVNLTRATLRVLAADGDYKPQTNYIIIENDGREAVVGQFAAITTNLAFLQPTVLYNGGTGNDVLLILVRKGSGFGAVASTDNHAAVAEAFEIDGDDQFPADHPLFLAVLRQTAEGARQAFDALSGEVYATLPGVLADDSRYVREAVLGRLVQATHTNTAGRIAALGSGGPQVASLNSSAAFDDQAMALGYEGKSLAAPPASYGGAFWTRAYGAWGDFEGNRHADTADRDLGGFLSGIDAGIGGSWRAGLAAGGSWSNVSVDARRSSAEVESFNLAGYAGGLAGPLALRGGGAWSWSDIDTDRAIIFPGFIERQGTSYNADTGQIFGEIAYPIAAGRIAFEPFADLAYVSIESESFRERGDPHASLTGRSGDEDIGYSTLGLRAAATTRVSNVTVVPKVSAAWQHAFDDETPDATLAFAATGGDFTIVGVPLAQDSILLEAGLDLSLSPTATLGVSYTGQFATDVSDNGVKGRLTWLF
jgi:outer membrane autotransporter protein